MPTRPINEVIQRLRGALLPEGTELAGEGICGHINPSGCFLTGGPHGDGDLMSPSEPEQATLGALRPMMATRRAS
jgi:hypothetical protein